MTYVVSLFGFTPGPRYNNTPWTNARIQEAAVVAGPWVTLETVALVPLDTDFINPMARNFTTSLAVFETGWYRVVFLDALSGEQPSGAVPYPPASAMTLTYAQVADLRAYVSAPLPESNEELTALLLRCEQEIDLSLPQVQDDNAIRKIILADQAVLAISSLKRATCAQAEYHLHMGEQFFIEGKSVPEGPDTNAIRVAPRIAPKAILELLAGGFLKRTGTMTQTGGVAAQSWTPSSPRRTA